MKTHTHDVLSIFPEHSSISADGELLIGGVPVTELADRFGTPAYVVDEAGLPDQARRMRDGLAARHPDSDVVFASKSFPCLVAYQLFAAEGLAIDVAGAGELVDAHALHDAVHISARERVVGRRAEVQRERESEDLRDDDVGEGEVAVVHILKSLQNDALVAGR